MLDASDRGLIHIVAEYPGENFAKEDGFYYAWKDKTRGCILYKKQLDEQHAVFAKIGG